MDRIKEIDAIIDKMEEEKRKLFEERFELIKNNSAWFVGTFEFFNDIDLEYGGKDYEICTLGWSTEEEARAWVEKAERDGLPDRNLHPYEYDYFRVKCTAVPEDIYEKFSALESLNTALRNFGDFNSNDKIDKAVNVLRIEKYKLEVELRVSVYNYYKIPEFERPDIKGLEY